MTELMVQVEADEDAEFTMLLRSELLDLDVAVVDWAESNSAPDNAKGLAGLATALVVKLASSGPLRAVVNAVRGWAARSNRTVEVSLGGDVLKLSGVTSAQQEKIIDAWIARHAAGT